MSAEYTALLELLELELELVGSGRFTEAEEVRRQRAKVIAHLAATPPAAARETLETARRLHRRLEIELLRAREALTQDLVQLERARRTASGYRPAPRPPRVVASA